MSRGSIADLMSTGFWLGLAQVDLGFHLLASQGAGALFYFAMLALWLAGALAGTVWQGGRRAGWWLLVVAAIAGQQAAVVARWLPFTGWSLAAGLGAVLLAGAYAGWFLQDRAIAAGPAVARVLFHENNGFIAGYAVAAMLLLVWVPALDALMLAAALLLVVGQFPSSSG